MTPIEILNGLYKQENPIVIEFHFDSGWNFCYGLDRLDKNNKIVFKESLQTYNPQDGFDWLEMKLKKGDK